MLRTIFVPLDISKSNEVVISYAIELAKRFHSQIVFLKTFHTAEYTYPASGIASIPPIVDSKALEGKEIYDEKLSYLTDRFPDLDTIPFELKVFAGSAKDLVNEVANDLGAELILIGTSGASGIDEIFGTVAEKVTREATCPVLVIPDEFQFTPLQKMSLALDVDNLQHKLHLDTLFHIAKSFNASIDVVNVSDQIDKADIHHNLIYSRIKDEFDESVNYFSIKILLKENEEKALSEYIDRNDIDLLSIVYREHGFFSRMFDPGLRKKMVFNTDIPLLVLK